MCVIAKEKSAKSANNVIYYFSNNRLQEIFDNFDISLDLDKNSLTLPDKSSLPITALNKSSEFFNTLVAVIVAHNLARVHEELDFKTLVVMILNEDCIKNRSLVKFCLVLMTDESNGQNFLYLLLKSAGYDSYDINIAIFNLMSKYKY